MYSSFAGLQLSRMGNWVWCRGRFSEGFGDLGLTGPGLSPEDTPPPPRQLQEVGDTGEKEDKETGRARISSEMCRLRRACGGRIKGRQDASCVGFLKGRDSPRRTEGPSAGSALLQAPALPLPGQGTLPKVF